MACPRFSPTFYQLQPNHYVTKITVSLRKLSKCVHVVIVQANHCIIFFYIATIASRIMEFNYHNDIESGTH